MRRDLDAMRDKLGISASGTPMSDNFSFIERYILSVKVALGKTTYQESLDKIDSANVFLRQTAIQSFKLEPSRRKRRIKQIAGMIRAIQERAISLYNVMVKGNSWTCSCREGHVTSLLLEARDVVSSPCFRLRILLSVDDLGIGFACSEWRDVSVEIQTLEYITEQQADQVQHQAEAKPRAPEVRFIESKSPKMPETPEAAESCGDQLRPTSDICSVMYECSPSNQQTSYVLDFDPVVYTKFRHSIHISTNQARYTIRTRSLESLLRTSQDHSIWLSRGDRLQIAVDIASSVLQLGNTPWLKRQWRCHDIIFHEPEDQKKAQSTVVTSNLYLAWPLSQAGQTIATIDDVSISDQRHLIRNEMLLYLSFALIELSLSKSLDELRTDKDNHSNETMARLNIRQVVRTSHDVAGLHPL